MQSIFVSGGITSLFYQAARRALTFSVAALLLSAAATAMAKPNASQSKPRAINVNSSTISSFSKTGLGGDQFGALKFLGGLVLTSSDAGFGGFSGLDISKDGKELIAVSDAGAWLRAKITYRNGRLRALDNATMGPLLSRSSQRLKRGRDRDAEAVRLISGSFDNGMALVSFELNARIGYFRIANGRLGAPIRYLRPPMRLRHNRGIEAVTQVQSGRYARSIVAFAERDRDRHGHHRGWLWHVPKKKKSKRSKQTKKLKVYPLAVRDYGGFSLTDVTSGPDGSLYLLERRFRWSEGVKMRIRHIAAKSLKPGAILDGRKLISADLGYQIDNMEGIDVHRNKAGKLVLTLISDNNFNSFLQRTLLLQFEIAG